MPMLLLAVCTLQVLSVVVSQYRYVYYSSERYRCRSFSNHSEIPIVDRFLSSFQPCQRSYQSPMCSSLSKAESAVRDRVSPLKLTYHRGST
ncbi:hypothetical protein F4821DRAFT_228265 [Hypoxylon rubiginosum]|uniref:Uncharacterized protein n=1 Tax=Hypoxylon rubiginosum TaxID=110542 RepID=A0ACC0DDW3_9PEZI|nr:hypothetical protein F4821DRAFT_228265 [Hypoxylon rubiginosum]